MKKNRAFVKYRKNGEIVPGSLILTNGGYPKGGPYKEITIDLCCDSECPPCPPGPSYDYGDWQLVTGGEAGDGVVLPDENLTDTFTIIGPNDDVNDGWVYLKRYFPLGGVFDVSYNWTSFDDSTGSPPSVDWPVYWSSVTEPTGIPGDLTVRVDDTPDGGVWNITVNPGEWFAIGIYSDDSCCSRGFLEVKFDF